MASLIINYLPTPATARPLEWICWRRVGERTAPFSASFPKVAATSCCSITNAVVKNNKWPWLMLPPSLDGTQLVYDLYSLADDKLISFNKRSDPELDDELPDDDATFFGSSHGWIVCCNRDKSDGKMFLCNPLSHRHVKLPEWPRGISDYPVNAIVENVIISSPDPANDLNCRAVMKYFSGKLAFCCPASPSSKWTLFGKKEGYCSLVYSARQKLFFCLTEYAGIEAWDLTSLNSPLMIPVKDQSFYPAHVNAYRYSSSPKYSRLMPSTSLALAHDSDDLYQVRRFSASRMGPDGSHGNINFSHYPFRVKLPFNTTLHFDVYKYDKELREWEYMDHARGLDGMAIFVGINHGFALSSKEYPHLKPDSVYFTDNDEFPCLGDVHGGLDLGIFNYRTKTISPCYYPRDHTTKKQWEYVDRCGLDGMALFVGRNHGFALSSKDHPELRPDSVYFTDVKSFPDFEDVGGGHDIGIFDYRNKTISPCYFPCDYHSIKKVLPPPFWFTPNYDPCYDNIDAQL